MMAGAMVWSPSCIYLLKAALYRLSLLVLCISRQLSAILCSVRIFATVDVDQHSSRIRKEKPGHGRTWEAFYIGGHSFPGPLKATAGPLPLLAFFASWWATRFFVSWLAAIGLTELLFFVSWGATPIFRELAEEKGSAYVLIYPLP